MKSPAIQHVIGLWELLPYKSHSNTNAVMQRCIKTAILAGLRFDPTDFRTINSSCRGGYWLRPEGLYSDACGGSRSFENISATISIEDFYGRKPFLWPEESKTPKRLYVGARFHWDGELVTVTSFNDSKASLVACSHKEDRTPKKVYKITHEQLMVKRRVADKLMKVHKMAIQGAANQVELDAAVKEASEDVKSMRHFDLEEIKAAIYKRGEEFNASTRLESDRKRRAEWEAGAEERAKKAEAELDLWMKGEAESMDFFTDTIRCRIRGEEFEVSNGNSVSLKSAKAAFQFVQKHRSKGWKSNGETAKCETYPIKSVDKDGVTIGCTFFEWSEIDRIAPFLQA